MLSPRERREQAEQFLICPHGILSAHSAGRLHPEPDCDIRTCFQRDTDRITHSKAFRRLKHKTQVFLQPEGDHYRTRLTHTLEVSRLARTMARALQLNEDLTEAIALGHDLGHTPFGHAGERALQTIYSEGFRHYEQSLRVADHIERGGSGLNLCFETRMGILHHTKGAPDDTLEAVLVRLSDRIAYINHDLDDAVRAGLLSESDLPAEVQDVIGTSHGARIDAIVRDLISHSGDGKIAMSPGMEAAVAQFHTFMFDAVYTNPAAKKEEEKVLGILEFLWNYYLGHPDALPADYRLIADRDGLARAVCDYISGMTDQYAIYRFSELFVPAAWMVR